ncbi:ATP-dependent helicase [bacterium SCSIO 12643]|nr:ATP-dependent helicase [bacterium SCSIO 12643]
MGIDYTNEQQKAFNTLDSDLQIIACAGSGKTEVISRRIINLLKTGKAVPENIIAFTYTEKAAGELKNRIYELVEVEFDNNLKGMAEMYIGTIHGWCFKILQEHEFEYQKFSVLDEIRLKLFVDKNYKTIGMKDIYQIDKPDLPMKMFVDTDKYIQIMNIVSEARVNPGKGIPKNVIEAREKYVSTLKENGYLDFSMIMSEAKKHLQLKGDFFHKVCDKIKYLTVDEYQDINPIQEDVIRLIHDSEVNICVVGDDDQNIYQWRGSDIDYIINFEERYSEQSEIQQVKLIQNFRSSEGVVDIAQSIIAKNKNRLDKKMVSSSHHEYERDNILYNDFDTEEEENDFIIESIKNLRGKAFVDKPGNDNRGLDYSDFVILIRKWSKAEGITKVLDSQNIPYVTGGVNKLFDSKEVKASLGIFEFLNNEIDEAELKKLWLEVDKSRITQERLSKAIEKLKEENPDREILKKDGVSRPVMYWEFCLQEIFWKFLENSGISEETFEKTEDKHDNTFGEVIMYNLGKFSQVINDFESINYKTGSSSFYLFNFLNFIKHAAKDYYPEGWINSTYKTPNAVQIITIHQSKGLEFPVVFIPGMNRNYFPSKRRGGVTEWKFLNADIIENSDKYRGIDDNNEAERRLFYVAVTRAKKYLFISRAPALNNRLYQKPSLFINEITNSDFLISSSSEKFDNLEELSPQAKDSTNNISLNFSILKDFFDCSYRFKLISIYGFASPLSPRMGFGKTIHDSLSEIHKRAFASENISKENTENIVSNHENFPYAPPELKKKMKKSARDVVSKYIEENQSEFNEIEFVEKDIQLNLGDGIFVSGRIDLIKKKDFKGKMETTIIEFKSNDEAQDKKITEEQLHLYALGHRELTGQKADYIRIYILQDKDESKEKKVIVSDRGIPKKLSEDHLTAIEGKIRNVVTDIRDKKFDKVCKYSICKECDQKLLCSGYIISKANK